MFYSGFRIRIQLIRIQIQHFFLIPDSDLGFDDQIEKIYILKFLLYFFYQKLQFT